MANQELTDAERDVLRAQSDASYREDVARTAKSNHIWLNAFNCINPTDEFKLQLANSILRMLNEEENTIRTQYARPGYIFADLNKRELIVSINKS